MSSRPSRRATRGQKRSAPVPTGHPSVGKRKSNARPRARGEDNSEITAEDLHTTPIQPGVGEFDNDSDIMIDPRRSNLNNSATGSMPLLRAQPPKGLVTVTGNNSDQVLALKAQVSALGLELSAIHERLCRTQEQGVPSIETPSHSGSISQLSPHSQLFTQTSSEGSISNLDPTRGNIPKGAKNLPAFDDSTEDFQTWKLRLESIAEIYNWMENQKRCVVMSSLRGEPAKFVFKALGPEVRNDYKALIEKLTTGFTKFKSKKVYRAKYRNLKQEPGQSEQELAATIKMIYGRAFPGRDRKISQEDMVSKFLEALHDNDQHTALEYPTVPETLDAAL